MKIRRRLLMIMLAASTTANIFAQDIKNQFNPVDYAVTSLMIAPDAKGAGFGDAGAATDPDANSQYWNPAKYPFCISRAGVAINYTPWLRQLVNDMGLANLSGYYRLGDYSALSASFRYFTLGEVYTSYDENAMTIKPYEMAFDIGVSRMLSESFSLAVAGRFIMSDLRLSQEADQKAATAFAADIAMYYNKYFNMGNRECLFGFGTNISNIGSKINFSGDDYSYFIPTNLRLGLNLTLPVDEYNKFSIAADANKLLVPTRPTEEQYQEDLAAGKTDCLDYQSYLQDNYYNISSIKGIFKSFGDAPNGFKEEMEEIQWSIGAEYTYHDQFSIRGGYHHEAENKGNRKYFTIGAGFKMSVFSLDVGYVIATAKSNPLDQTMRFSLAFDMDGINDLFKRGNR
ncbi:MAG: type IX secretion system outer membrane channel protein PorV [Prevotellaceae bacterium]|nr:type IX secretion system outer membrane channel protein PorV [Prevotellaceae bacterium]